MRWKNAFTKNENELMGFYVLGFELLIIYVMIVRFRLINNFIIDIVLHDDGEIN